MTLHSVDTTWLEGMAFENTADGYKFNVDAADEFGGMKNSGYGRESGFQAVMDYTRPKAVWMNTSDDAPGNPFVMR